MDVLTFFALLVFGVPLALFALIWAMVKHIEDAVVWMVGGPGFWFLLCWETACFFLACISRD